jgi:hypothetical protein
MSLVASQNKDLNDNQVLVRIFFRTTDDPKKKGRRKVENNLEGKAFCLRCEKNGIKTILVMATSIVISLDLTLTGRYYLIHILFEIAG